jgi:hypothetical protein
VPCTIDLVYDGSRRTVRDWKTGFEGVPDPATSLQLGLGALCVARDEWLDEVDVEIARIDSAGGTHINEPHGEPIMLDAFALDEMADRWRSVVRGVLSARETIAAGGTVATNPSRTL